MCAITKVATARTRKRCRKFVKSQARVPNKSECQRFFRMKGPWSRNAPLLDAKITIHDLSAPFPSRLINARTTHFRPERLATTMVAEGSITEDDRLFDTA